MLSAAEQVPTLAPTPAPTAYAQCKLLGGVFAYMVQCSLGLICLLALVVKWRCERPRRSGKVFLADGCKQAIAALVAHGFNMLLAAGLQKAAGKGADECAWYFMNYIWDTVLGVWVAYAMLMHLERVARRRGWPSLARSGDYGQGEPGAADAPNLVCSTREVWFRTWFKQLAAWTAIEVLMKAMLAGVQYGLRRPLGVLAREILTAPFRGDPHAELVVVMVAAPGAMNVIIFWIQDTFLQRQPDGEPGCLGRCWRRARRGACCPGRGGGGGGGSSRGGSRGRLWSESDLDAPLMNGRQDYHSAMAGRAAAAAANGAAGTKHNNGGSRAVNIRAVRASPPDDGFSMGLGEFGGTPGATPGENEILAAALRWQESAADFDDPDASP